MDRVSDNNITLESVRSLSDEPQVSPTDKMTTGNGASNAGDFSHKMDQERTVPATEPTDDNEHTPADKSERSCLRRFLAWDGCLAVLSFVGAGVGIPGELYMQMLKAAVLPLIISSIIPGTAALKPKENGRVAVRRLNLFPDNVVAACFQKVQTRYRDEGNGTAVRYLSTAGGTNILGLVIVCTAVGMAAAQTGDAAQPFLRFFLAAADVIIRLVQWIIWLTPIGVASLIAKALASTTDLESTFLGLGLFVLAEVIGNFLLAFILVPAIYLVFLRKNPFLFLAGASRAIITGVASASSAVTMPEIINCVERKHYVDVRVSRFVVPLATAINRDGSAMFIALTSVYIAQLQGADTANNIILLVILAAVGSLAIPGVPSASIVTILMILSSLDISPANIGIIIALEWFSDRMRAVPNMVSHVLCGVLTWHLCKASLGFERRQSVLEPHEDVVNMGMKPKADGDSHNIRDTVPS
ncbi:hypothetical protein BaRGS_00003845 [Batillaria attramentaria]|uniref:Amino acid transporter n=1 Tax=Batillaria attramentaria TaxID=370345 RepID=A0ABD0LZK6_9CAEN